MPVQNQKILNFHPALLYEKVEPVLVEELSDTLRGTGGYGSTGI